ncbi:sensor histidine kinase [Neolewinella antarctica]|uniref:Signal transduction histidine kinase internal region domain-containing protein n=1 Tax=Neolewinella antarctica TaxID=442734 RepID=A0ABX0XA30_9BACT|nr:sensor histidine kinase [Neolewinella antarctica]NJC25813.1 hypothetical protein [Neolewinella antarctica]
MKLPFRPCELFAWFLLVYVLRGPVRRVMLSPTPVEELSDLVTWPSLVLTVTGCLAFFSYSLSAYSILYCFQRKRPWWQLLVAILAGVFVCVFFRAFLEEGLLRWVTGRGNYNPATTVRYYIFDNLYFAVIYTSVGMIFYFARLSGFNRDRAQRAELEKRTAALKFLRSQVNPHFLFNTLNSVYAQVQAGSGQALKTIERLSDLMRYSLYEKKDLVPLAREIDYLVDFIELENMRLSVDRRASISAGVFHEEWYVPPMLFVPFVENAFKHGDGSRGTAPIKVELHEDDHSALVFTVVNRKSTRKTSIDQVGGIGIFNVRQRLNLLYPGRHTLDVEDGENDFSIRLTLSAK